DLARTRLGLRAFRPTDPDRRSGDRAVAVRGLPGSPTLRSRHRRRVGSGQAAPLRPQVKGREMLYHVQMDVIPPPDVDPKRFEKLKADEKAMSQELQRSGKWRHLWRIAGRYSNISVLDVESHDELHALLSSLPLFPFMEITVTPLARHPSAID